MIINKKYIIEMDQGNNGNISTRLKRLCKATQFLLKSYKSAISIAIFSSAWPQTHISLFVGVILFKNKLPKSLLWSNLKCITFHSCSKNDKEVEITKPKR